MPVGHRETGRGILPISVDEFFNLFHAADAPYTFERYFVYRGYKKIELAQPWAENFTEPELKQSWGKPSLKQKSITYEVDVSGTALSKFVKATPTTKNYILLPRESKH